MTTSQRRLFGDILFWNGLQSGRDEKSWEQVEGHGDASAQQIAGCDDDNSNEDEDGVDRYRPGQASMDAHIVVVVVLVVAPRL